jgi:type I restriction enzyme S subunit
MIALNGQGKTRATVAMLRTEATCNQSLVCIYPKDRTTLFAEFVYANLYSRYEELRRLTSDDDKDRRGLNMGLIRNIRIPVPPHHDQVRIVGILNEALSGIATARANTEKNLENATELFNSKLRAAFAGATADWKTSPLSELCEANRVITYGVIKLGDHAINGVPCLRTSNVRWLRIDHDDVKRISPSLSADYSRTILKGGEVLVNVRGTLGGVAVVEPSMVGWNVSREVAVVPVDRTRIHPKFLAYLIGSGVSQEWLGDVEKGATYVGINIEDLRQLPVAAPSLAEQEKVAFQLDAIYAEKLRLEGVYLRKIAALDELKQSLLHQAFSGQM